MIQVLFFLVNHLWQSTLVAAVGWFACRTMLKFNSPAVRFVVWMAVTVKFLVPFAVFVDAGHRLYNGPVLTPARSQQIFAVIRAASTGLAATPVQSAHAPLAATGWTGIASLLSIALWALGASVVFIRWIASWWTIHRAARQAIPHGEFRGVPVLKSTRMRDDRIEPGVFGLWRQVILIPEGMQESLSRTQFRTVLAHEWN